ncbi:MaoC family dehydratase [Hyphococcus flavus]|uniref:MaoC family dehydratase n=1 Tax=Hyphococcus flavus TaxID=1866326 RepID=A0AAE9ZGH3_9PROT|nr:MaoC family dehydratase [Hyphococcus flavus]WDI32327.1 MaoC family dehydratase [Hyphococcus flavus]
MPVVTPDQINDYIGKEVGVSDWVLVDQDRIDKFADVTEDLQFIHVDPEAAAKTPFGGTIAHGFLTLSMLSKMAAGAVLILEGIKMGVNYGFEKVRFVNAVRAGKKIRARFALKSVEKRSGGQWSLVYDVKVEIDGEEKPALIAEWLTMQVV